MRLTGLLFLIAVLRGLLGATPSTPAELAGEMHDAIQSRNTAALRALLFVDNMSAEDIGEAHARLDSMIGGQGQLSVTPERLHPAMAFTKIRQGFRIEPNLKPTGIIRVTWKEGPTSVVNTLPCGEIDGRCLLTGLTQIDLGWKGPPDRAMGFSLEDLPTGVHLVVVKYNVSGVDVEERYSGKSAVFEGQHIDELTITGLTENFRGKLVVRDEGKAIHDSPWLSGLFTHTYRRAQK